MKSIQTACSGFFISILLLIAFVLANCAGGGGDGGGSDGTDGTDGSDISGESVDTTAPAKIHLNTLSAYMTEITFTWTDPTDNDFDHLVVTCSGREATVEAGLETYTLSDLTGDTQYEVSVKSFDTTGNGSEAAVFYFRTNTTNDEIAYVTVADAIALDAVRNNLAGNYLLTADIDLSDVYWIPIGDYATDINNIFTGVFNGNGFTVSNLTIDSTSDYQGLFGRTSESVISSLGIIKADIAGGACTGGLVGENYSGTVSDSYATGSVSSRSSTDWCIGGLVGYNNSGTVSKSYASVDVSSDGYNIGGLMGCNAASSTVSKSYATGSVSGADKTGGLVGGNTASSNVSDSYATGSVSGEMDAGGFVGLNHSSTISGSHATGSVNSTSLYTGGLVGRNYSGTISDSYATAAVSGGITTGGLVGFNTESSTVSSTYATGSVSGLNYTGGLVGENNSGTIFGSYASGSVSGPSGIGGLVGRNYSGTVSNSYATGSVSCDNSLVGGLVGTNESSSTVSDSFYDLNTTGMDDEDKGTAKTTAEMKTLATFTDTSTNGLDAAWDFVGDPNDDASSDDIWDLGTSINNGYPYLAKLKNSY